MKQLTEVDIKKPYSEKLRDPRWQKLRLEVFNRDKFTCSLCSDKDTELHIHHKHYRKGAEPWEYDINELMSLCKDCHKYLHYNDNVLPYRIIKRTCGKDVFLFGIGEVGLTFYPSNIHISVISHTALKEIVHTVINYWLIEGMEHNLIDYGIEEKQNRQG